MKRANIGQGERRPKSMWVLFDTINGHMGKRYLWWFPSRVKAVEHRDHQNADPNNVRVVGPYRYVETKR